MASESLCQHGGHGKALEQMRFFLSIIGNGAGLVMSTLDVVAGAGEDLPGKPRPANFLDLGGDSIEAIQIQHSIHRDFDLRIKNTEFLAEPTIAALAALIEARATPAAA